MKYKKLEAPNPAKSSRMSVVAVFMLAGALGLTGCTADTVSVLSESVGQDPTADASEEVEASYNLSEPIPTTILCEVLSGSDLGVISAASAEKRDESEQGGNSRCIFAASDGAPSEIVLQLVSNTSAVSGAAFELPDLSSKNCTGGQDTALTELAGLETAAWYCLDSDTSMNVYLVSTYFANATLRGTSLRCEISTVNRPGLDPAAAESWCAGVLTDLDSSL
jgi:hypothetical protein